MTENIMRVVLSLELAQTRKIVPKELLITFVPMRKVDIAIIISVFIRRAVL
jgi:hypothetical protein